MSQIQTGDRGVYGRSAPYDQRRQWFVDGDIPVAVYGLGKMGLPLAAVYAETTGNVIGVDIDEETVERIKRGECPIENEPRLPYLISMAVETERLRVTTDSESAARNAAIHVVIVPTKLSDDNSVDLSALRAATRSIGSGLTAGDLVIVESTVPPGTCRDFVGPLLESESGLEIGTFGLAFCPERTSSGRAIRDIRGAYPRIVGGIDMESRRSAELVYGEITSNRVIPVSGITTAECVKVFEGVYRDVNIALANELARTTDELGIDVREAIDAANTQPFCNIHDPGPGVGGHCIPYYPYFLIEKLVTETPLLHTARDINESMPEYTVSKVLDGLHAAGKDPSDATVAILGIAYRPGVEETSESPAFPIIDRLHEVGATIVAIDPIVSDLPESGVAVSTVEGLADRDPDAVVLVTPHEAFDDIDWSEFDDLVIVDGRDALDPDTTGHELYTIGRG